MKMDQFTSLEYRYGVQGIESTAIRGGLYLMDQDPEERLGLLVHLRAGMIRRLRGKEDVLLLRKQDIKAFAEELLEIYGTYFEEERL